jgi:glyoxylase-like metal-dependent hydrolase (beta-lactamase superfamily II)
MKLSQRRDFLKTLLGGTAGISLSTKLLAQGAPTPITATKVTDNFILITGAGSNVLVVSGPDGLLLVNSGRPESSAELLKLVSAQGDGKRIQVMFNTDWRLDNTGANDTLGKAGTRIFSHENTKLWMSTEFHVQWERKTYMPRAKEALPNQTFYTSGKMMFGKEEIQYGHLGQAHTDGDIYVYFPGPNILATGDVVTVGSYPVLDWSTGGWIGGLSDACKTLVGLTNAQTKVIPGKGPVQTSADLKAQADMCAAMRQKFVDMMKKGMSASAMAAAAPTKEFDARWGDPELFMANAYPGLWNHVRELGGIL